MDEIELEEICCDLIKWHYNLFCGKQIVSWEQLTFCEFVDLHVVVEEGGTNWQWTLASHRGSKLPLFAFMNSVVKLKKGMKVRYTFLKTIRSSSGDTVGLVLILGQNVIQFYTHMHC